MTQENSLRIDFMKFVCAVMVVAMHSGWPTSSPWSGTWLMKQLLWNRGVTFIAVPFFFVCSGFFLARHLGSRSDWRHAVRKRVRTLVVPFFVWSFVYAVVLPIPIGLSADLLARRPLGTTLIAVCHGTDWLQSFGICLKWPGLGPLWYVRNLFFLVLTAPLLWWIVRTFGCMWLCFCFLASLLFWLLPESDARMFFFRFYSVLGLLYFSCGLYLYGNRVVVTRLGKGGGAVAFLIVELILASKGRELSLHLLESLSIPFVLIWFWKLMPARRLPSWLADVSFPIYVLHSIVFMIIGPVLHHVPGLETMPRTYATINFLAGVFGSIVIAHILRRFFPRFARIAFGDR